MSAYSRDMGRKPVALKDRPPLGAHLHRLRVAASLTQADLAQRLGITQASVAQWELSGSRPRTELLPKLAAALGVTIDELLLPNGAIKRRPGPVGKLQRLFEEASELPRSQQDKVVTVLEAVLHGIRADDGV